MRNFPAAKSWLKIFKNYCRPSKTLFTAFIRPGGCQCANLFESLCTWSSIWGRREPLPHSQHARNQLSHEPWHMSCRHQMYFNKKCCLHDICCLPASWSKSHQLCLFFPLSCGLLQAGPWSASFVSSELVIPRTANGSLLPKDPSDILPSVLKKPDPKEMKSLALGQKSELGKNKNQPRSLNGSSQG